MFPFFVKFNVLFCLGWFLTPLSFPLHLCWLLFPDSSTCFKVLATWIYSLQWILRSWVGLQVAANVLYRWLHKSWFISSGGDRISLWCIFGSTGSRADSPGHAEAAVWGEMILGKTAWEFCRFIFDTFFNIRNGTSSQKFWIDYKLQLALVFLKVVGCVV